MKKKLILGIIILVLGILLTVLQFTFVALAFFGSDTKSVSGLIIFIFPLIIAFGIFPYSEQLIAQFITASLINSFFLFYFGYIGNKLWKLFLRL